MSTTFGKCPHCHKDARSVRLWSEGVCLYHFKNPPGKRAVVKPTAVEVQGIVAIKPPTKKQLDAWFLARAMEIPELCEEPGCGRRLYAEDTWRIKAMVAHVVPKKLFWSVATHPLNRVFVCKTPHHDDYDSSWDRAAQMGVWPLAVERFQQFMHLITDTELRHLPPALRTLTNR